jgi:hypothetical protein
MAIKQDFGEAGEKQEKLWTHRVKIRIVETIGGGKP